MEISFSHREGGECEAVGKILAPIVRTPAGKLWPGPSHAEAIMAHASPQLIQRAPKWFASERLKGFRTNRQPFVSRGEGKAIGKKARQIKPGEAPEWRKRLGKGLHSQDLRDIPKSE